MPQHSSEEARREAAMADLVMAYLSEHPRAMDTFEGVAEWWVARQQIRIDLRMLARVLEQLTEKGVLEKIGSGERARYGMKRNQD